MNFKSIPLAILLSCTLPAALPAAESLVDPQTEYDKAVKVYVDAATDYMKGVRTQVDAQLKDATEETKARFKKTTDAIDQADRLLFQLKNCTRTDFDRVKAEFERARDRLVKELEALQKSG